MTTTEARRIDFPTVIAIAAIAGLVANQLHEAEATLRHSIAEQPDALWLRLILFAVQRKQGEGNQAVSELRAFVKENDDDEWPAPLASFYLGESNEEALLAAAGDEDDEAHESHLCEANYYAGLFYATQSPPDLTRARARFDAAASSPASDLEKGFAEQDRRQMDREQAIHPHPQPNPHPVPQKKN